ncbi:hypothetical protein [Plantactinospora endophytica]|uniref:hypothetical protein n=1 Tax=Plantactinospora endophytica TaxID=673535 RepID=UPI001944C9AE|nr:hypothetical protein [Plantactinospora endophytica]
MAERSTRNPGTAAVDTTRWRHPADDTPICFDEAGHRCQPVWVEETVPVDDDARAWLDEMAGLFAPDGVYSPGRLGTAITAIEHLDRWLRMATGPFSALMTMPAPADVAHLLGHLYRTTLLLARIQTQVGDHVTSLIRRQPDIDVTDDTASGAWAEARGHVHDTRDLLDAAAEITASSVGYTAAAWSRARQATTAWAIAVPAQPPTHPSAADHPDDTDDLSDDRPTMPGGGEVGGQAGDDDGDESFGQELPGGLTHDQLGELLGVAFGDSAPFSPQMTGIASRAAGTLVTYLATCLGTAGTAALPAPSDLASLATSLTYLSHTLADGLRRFTHRQTATGNGSGAFDGTDAVAVRTSLDKAADGLRIAARHLTAASYTAAGIRPPDER